MKIIIRTYHIPVEKIKTVEDYENFDLIDLKPIKEEVKEIPQEEGAFIKIPMVAKEVANFNKLQKRVIEEDTETLVKYYKKQIIAKETK